VSSTCLFRCEFEQVKDMSGCTGERERVGGQKEDAGPSEPDEFVVCGRAEGGAPASYSDGLAASLQEGEEGNQRGGGGDL
jgi:hypothetical protein